MQKHIGVSLFSDEEASTTKEGICESDSNQEMACAGEKTTRSPSGSGDGSGSGSGGNGGGSGSGGGANDNGWAKAA